MPFFYRPDGNGFFAESGSEQEASLRRGGYTLTEPPGEDGAEPADLNGDGVVDDLEKKTVAELQYVATTEGLQGFDKLKKAELIAAIREKRLGTETMADLITRVRRLIDDKDSDTFDDDEVQDALDQHRQDVRYLPLDACETVQPSHTVVWLDYYSNGRDSWESDVQLLSNSYAPISAETSDYLTGHWIFAENTIPPVLLIGKHYDVYAAAADLLEAWAGKVKMKYDASSKDQSLKRSQMIDHCLQLAEKYRERSRPISATMVRCDVN